MIQELAPQLKIIECPAQRRIQMSKITFHVFFSEKLFRHDY